MKQSARTNDELKRYFEDLCVPYSSEQKNHTLKRKEVLFQQGDVATTFAYVLSGRLSVINHHSENDFIITSICAGDVVGEMGLFLSEKVRTTSVVAAEDTSLLVITYQDFIKSLDRDYLPLFHLSKVMALRLQATTRHADSIATKSVKDRLVDLLIEMQNSPATVKSRDESYTFKMSRKEMSLRIGCSRELAGKHLSELEVSGYLRCSGMKITVTPKLKESR